MQVKQERIDVMIATKGGWPSSEIQINCTLLFESCKIGVDIVEPEGNRGDLRFQFSGHDTRMLYDKMVEYYESPGVGVHKTTQNDTK